MYEDRIDLKSNVYLVNRTSAGSAMSRQLSMPLKPLLTLPLTTVNLFSKYLWG